MTLLAIKVLSKWNLDSHFSIHWKCRLFMLMSLKKFARSLKYVMGWSCWRNIILSWVCWNRFWTWKIRRVEDKRKMSFACIRFMCNRVLLNSTFYDLIRNIFFIQWKWKVKQRVKWMKMILNSNDFQIEFLDNFQWSKWK